MRDPFTHDWTILVTSRFIVPVAGYARFGITALTALFEMMVGRIVFVQQVHAVAIGAA